MKKLTLIVALFAALTGATFTPASAQVRDVLRQAGVYVEAGRLDEAAALVQGFTPSGRDERYAWNLLGGKAAMARNQPGRAIDYFEQAQRIAGNSYPAAIGKAQAHLALGELIAARLQADAAARLASSVAEPELVRALVDLRTGKTHEALQRMEALAKRQPGADDVAVAHARLLVMTGDIEGAKAALIRFTDTHPASPAAFDMLGEMASAAGDTDAAVQFKSQAARLYGEQGKAFRREVALAWLDARSPLPAAPAQETPAPVEPPSKPALLPQARGGASAVTRFPFPPGVTITGGSGFIVDGGRRVVTNRHVIEGGKAFAVRTGLGEVVKATVVVTSTTDDLAILELEQALPADRAVPDDAYVRPTVGKTVVVMGYPLWYLLGEGAPSLTNGIVSKGTGMKDDAATFQLTAKINKGNSGGPVFDLAGNVVGITVGKLDTIRIRDEQGFIPEDVNFAIHVDRLPAAAKARIGSPGGVGREMSLEELYQQSLGKVVMVATYR